MTDIAEPVLTAPARDPATFSFMEQLAEDGLLDDYLAATPADERANVLPYQWRLWGRPSQLMPAGDDWDLWFIRAGRGFGKLLSVGTPLPTPDGWTSMGDVAVGDDVLDEAGRPTTVLWASEVQYEDSWRVTFSDGSSLIAHGEHQWITWTHADRKALLRSLHEPVRDRFPDDWPTWRVRRTSKQLGRSVVERAIALHAAGLSIRRAAIEIGVSRHSLAPHIAAGRYLPQSPRPFRNALGPQVRTTADVRATLTHNERGDRNHCIPTCAPLQLGHADLPLDPYVLGAWLGDGDSSGGAITGAADDLAVIRSSFEQAGERTHALKAYEGKASRFRADGLTSRLRSIGVLRDKHVPAAYLRSSVDQRLALLQGLMDTDGGVDAASHASFTSTSERIADAVRELVVSLGMVARRDKRPARLNGIEHGTAYRVSFTPTLPVFRLPRKAERCRATGPQMLRHRHRMIVSIERIPTVPMRCITVDSPNALYLAGEAMIPTHNTQSGAEGVRELVTRRGYRSGTVIGRNPAEARDVMVEGPTGIIAVHPPHFRPVYESSKRLITWPNGALAHVRSAEDPDSIRGLNSDWVWGDEPASYRSGPAAWDQAMLGNRVGPHPVGILTGTPRPLPWLRELEGKATTRLSTGALYENLTNLAPSFVRLVLERYAGTRLGRQEIDAEYLEDVEGALWVLSVIEASRFPRFDRSDPWRSLAVELSRRSGDGGSPSSRFGRGSEIFANERRPWVTVVAVDPPGESAECGIAVGTAPRNGKGGRDHCVVLDDMSMAGTPEEWGAQVVAAYRRWDADYILVEKNQGQDMTRGVIHNVDPTVNVEKMSAQGSKVDRAEPVSVLYAKGWVHHLGHLPGLENQQTTWVPAEGKSPDRIDALVHLVTRLTPPGSVGRATIPDQSSLASRRV